MAQLRFQLGIPRAGSAARSAESNQDRFRAIKPEAGSAARKAEEERRAADADREPQRPRVVSLRVQSRTGLAAQGNAVLNENRKQATTAQKSEEISQSSTEHQPYPENATRAGGQSVAQAPHGDAIERTLPNHNPLQTAAKNVMSLLRSTLPFSRRRSNSPELN